MKDQRSSKYTRLQRVFALLAVIALIGLSVATLLVAIFGTWRQDGLFVRLMAATIFVPILLWLFMWAVGGLTGKRNVASFTQDKEEEGMDHAEKMARAMGSKAVPASERRKADGRIRTVVLDIGGVLVGFDFYEFIMGKVHDEELTKRVIKASVHNPYWKEYDRGYMSSEEIMDHFCESDPEIADILRSTFADIDGMLTHRDESIPWIQALERAGYRVLVLSNYSSRALDGCPDANDFLAYVDGGILSYRDHLIKPDEEIYRLLMERYGLTAEETVFVDDTQANIDAALAIGWSGVTWHTREQTYEELHALGVNW